MNQINSCCFRQILLRTIRIDSNTNSCRYSVLKNYFVPKRFEVRLLSTIGGTSRLNNNRLLNLRRMLLLSNHHQNLILRQSIRKYSKNTVDKILDFNVASFTLIAVSFIYITLNTFLVDYYAKAFTINDRSIIMNRKNVELVYDVIEGSHIKPEYKVMDKAQLEISNNFQPRLLSNFMSRFGFYILFPEYFNFENQADIDEDKIIRKLQLDQDRLEEFSYVDQVSGESCSAMDQLRKSLILSEEAKKFFILSQMHSASTGYDPFVTALLLFSFPAAAYNLAKRFPVARFAPMPALAFGYLLSGIGCYFVKYVQEKYSLWATVKYEINQTDSTTNNHNPEDIEENKLQTETERRRRLLFEGGLEYLQKTSQLNQLIYNYTNSNRIKYRFSRSGEFVDYKDFFSLLVVYPNHRRIKDLKSYYATDPEQLTVSRFLFG